MRLFLTVLGVFAAAMLLMSVGVILRKRAFRGSCGGLAGLRDERGNTLCDACTNPSELCDGSPDATRRAEQELPSSK